MSLPWHETSINVTPNNGHFLLLCEIWDLCFQMSSVSNSSFVVMVWTMTFWKPCLSMLSSQKLLYLVLVLSDHQYILWASVSIFSWPPNGHWRPFDQARNWGSKGLKLRKVAARVRFYLQIRKSLLTGRAAQKWKVQAATVVWVACGGSHVSREGCSCQELGHYRRGLTAARAWDSTTATWARVDSRRL